jgi:hypothetical protein
MSTMGRLILNYFVIEINCVLAQYDNTLLILDKQNPSTDKIPLQIQMLVLRLYCIILNHSNIDYFDTRIYLFAEKYCVKRWFFLQRKCGRVKKGGGGEQNFKKVFSACKKTYRKKPSI